MDTKIMIYAPQNNSTSQLESYRTAQTQSSPDPLSRTSDQSSPNTQAKHEQANWISVTVDVSRKIIQQSSTLFRSAFSNPPTDPRQHTARKILHAKAMEGHQLLDNIYRDPSDVLGTKNHQTGFPKRIVAIPTIDSRQLLHRNTWHAVYQLEPSIGNKTPLNKNSNNFVHVLKLNTPLGEQPFVIVQTPVKVDVPTFSIYAYASSCASKLTGLKAYTIKTITMSSVPIHLGALPTLEQAIEQAFKEPSQVYYIQVGEDAYRIKPMPPGSPEGELRVEVRSNNPVRLGPTLSRFTLTRSEFQNAQRWLKPHYLSQNTPENAKAFNDLIRLQESLVGILTPEIIQKLFGDSPSGIEASSPLQNAPMNIQSDPMNGSETLFEPSFLESAREDELLSADQSPRSVMYLPH